jgi:hypothetical protein
MYVATNVETLIAAIPARVIVIAGLVSVLTQFIKGRFPDISGTGAMAVNLALSLAGIFATMHPIDFWTLATFQQVVEVFVAAAGIHSTARSLRHTVPDIPAKALVLFLALAVSTLTVSGCALKTAKVAAPLPIGAVDPVDANANETLQAAHAFALLITTDVQSGKLTLTASQRSVVNKLNLALNTADAAEIAYHKAGGGSASVLDASLTAATNALLQVQTALAPPLAK